MILQNGWHRNSINLHRSKENISCLLLQKNLNKIINLPNCYCRFTSVLFILLFPLLRSLFASAWSHNEFIIVVVIIAIAITFAQKWALKLFCKMFYNYNHSVNYKFVSFFIVCVVAEIDIVIFVVILINIFESHNDNDDTLSLILNDSSVKWNINGYNNNKMQLLINVSDVCFIVWL